MTLADVAVDWGWPLTALRVTGLPMATGVLLPEGVSLKLTVPVGAAPPPVLVTVAVKLTVWP